MTLKQIQELLREAKKPRTVESAAFEGGEPFLYYPIMLSGIKEAHSKDFKVEALSNAYWATCSEDAQEWLRPLELGVADLGLSSDTYHGEGTEADRVEIGVEEAQRLGIRAGMMATTRMPQKLASFQGEVTELMYRGRAVKGLVEGTPRKPWTELGECTREKLAFPERVHVDPLSAR